MDFLFEPLTLQFLGFLNTENLFGSEDHFGYPSFETAEAVLSEDAELKLELPDGLILGKRVEYFFAFYIRHFSSEKILVQNQVISKNRITMGEVDFILQNKETQKLSHIELIYKYYLYDPNFEEELEKWIGPNRKDTLVRKLEKLKQHQFPLLFREEARRTLEPVIGPSEKVEQKICFKASLFVPLEIRGQELPLINNSGIKGYWIRQDEFSEEGYGDDLYYSPEKRYWPIDPKYCSNWYSFREISEKIDPLLSRQSSPLLWRKMKIGSIEQFFVVWW